MNLEEINTHKLRSMLKTTYSTNGVYYPDYDNFPNVWISDVDIKAELAKRPHIPNKSERAKAINQAKGLNKVKK